MGAIFLRFPGIASPTVTLQINPVWCPRGINYVETPFQQRLRSIGGQAFRVKLSEAVDTMLEVDFVDLPEDDELGFSGFSSLNTFIRTTLDFYMLTCDLTDGDGVTTTVLFWTSQKAFREMEGQVNRSGFFTGQTRWLKYIPPTP